MKGDGDGMVGDKGAGMVVFLSSLGFSSAGQVMEMVQGLEVRLKDIRGGQGWTWSPPKIQHGP